MANEPVITVVGNLVADPDLRFTQSGQAVASMRLASTPRTKDKNTQEWTDGTTLWLGVTAWRQMAENCAESLRKGMSVIVVGRLQQRDYTTREGEKRSSYEIQADSIGPNLERATATVNKISRSNGQAGGQPDAWATQGPAAQPIEDQWSTPAPQQSANPYPPAPAPPQPPPPPQPRWDGAQWVYPTQQAAPAPQSVAAAPVAQQLWNSNEPPF